MELIRLLLVVLLAVVGCAGEGDVSLDAGTEPSSVSGTAGTAEDQNGEGAAECPPEDGREWDRPDGVNLRDTDYLVEHCGYDEEVPFDERPAIGTPEGDAYYAEEHGWGDADG